MAKSKYQVAGGCKLPRADYPYKSPFDDFVHNTESRSLKEVARIWSIDYENLRKVAGRNGWTDERKRYFQSQGVQDGPAPFALLQADMDKAMELTRQFENGELTDDDLRARMRPLILRGLLSHAMSADASTSRGALAELLVSLQKTQQTGDTANRFERASPGELLDLMSKISDGQIPDELRDYYD